jgi:hypothetical protein
MKKEIILRDPDHDHDDEMEPDDVKMRVEAALAAGKLRSSSSK